MDMVFSLLPAQENSFQQNMLLYSAFIDFSKVADTVTKKKLCRVFQKLGCPEKFLNLAASLYDGMQTCVEYENVQPKGSAV